MHNKAPFHFRAATALRSALKALLPGLCVLLLLALQPAHAQQHSIEISEFYIYPEAAPDFNKRSGSFTWPEVETLNALVRAELSGFAGETKVDAFLVIHDEEGELVSKHKAKHFLTAGTHDIVFPEVVYTRDYFGEAGFDAEVELSIKGAAPVRAQTGFELEGPPVPEMEVHSLKLYSPQGNTKDTYFEPGDEFYIEGQVEIGENESGVKPQLILYAVMEEDSFLLDPFYENQSYLSHWDKLEMNFSDGLIGFRARGRLPYFFADPYEYRHPFRVYAIVSFGRNAEESDYAEGELTDSNYGDHRRSDIVEDRLIDLERSANWTLRRGRPPRGDEGRYFSD